MRQSLITLLLLIANLITAQQLTYKSGGNILNSDHKKLTKSEVRQLLSDKPALLNDYNSGRLKKTIGSNLIGGGIGVAFGSFAAAYVTDSKYPVLGIGLGVGLIAVGIPIRVGYSKKIKRAVDGYNNSISYRSPAALQTALCCNKDGIEIRITF